MTENPAVLTAALAWHAAGFSVVPVLADGSKAPAGGWKRYQAQPATAEQVRSWFTAGRLGVGLVMGAVSGHAEMLELEGRAVDEGLAASIADLMAEHGQADLWQRLRAGYLELTPSGGVHLIYRVAGGVGGNTKLVRRPARDDELTDTERALLAKGRTVSRVLVETRGEGGYVVVAPSHGSVHPSGRSWDAAPHARAGHVITLTADERDILHAVVSLLDHTPTAPEPTPFQQPGAAAPTVAGGIAPGDDYNARGDWHELLTPHGWRVARQLAGRTYWTRPGKDRGISAVTGGAQGDYFWCWSSTVADLPTEQALSKWRTYALLEHGGDWATAAAALRKAGYGSPPAEPHRPVFLAPPAAVDDRDAASGEPPAVQTLALSDDGNAQLLVAEHGHHIRYCPDRGRWLAWNGTRWAWCPPGGGVVREYAKQVCRLLPEASTPERLHKRRSLSANGTTATLLQAASDPRVVVGLDQLDAQPYELNTPTGIVDLRTGRLRPHDPAALHTRSTTIGYRPDATSERWADFLDVTFGQADLVEYLRRLVGYSVTGAVHDHVLPFCHGPGGNGKGVFLETVRAVLGDYATTAPSGFLMSRAHAQHETEIARLAGARMVICSEVGDEDRFDEVKVKQLTGGDTLTARFMRQDHFTFTPTHTLWLMGNHQPAVRAGGYSFWRRVRLIPFRHTVADADRVDDLQGILAAGQHGTAVLAWIVAGAVAYLQDGPAEPESVRAATNAYAHNQDTVGRFLEECCHLGGAPHVQIKVGIVRAAYEKWCSTEGEIPVSAKALGLALARHGVGSHRIGKARMYLGLSLLDPEEAPEPIFDGARNGSENASPSWPGHLGLVTTGVTHG